MRIFKSKKDALNWKKGNKNRRIKKYMSYIGPKGGRYIIKNGKKVYFK